MIQTDMLYKPSLNYIKKERFTGSFQGMRYLLEKTEVVIETKEEINEETGEMEQKEIKEPRIHTAVWPEPFAYDKTAEEFKTHAYFALTQVGLEEAWNWIGGKQDEVAKK